MLNVLIDNNALEYLSRTLSVSEYDILNKHHEHGRITLFISPIVFNEQIKGVNELSFKKVQRLFKSAYDLTYKGHFYVDPELHIGLTAKLRTKEEALEAGRLLIRMLREFIRVNSYAEWSSAFSPLVTYINTTITGIHDGAMQIRQLMTPFRKKRIGGNSRYAYFENDEEMKVARGFLRDGLLRRFKIALLQNNPEGEAVIRRLNSIEYMIDAYIYYYGSVLLERDPITSDHFDIEQLVYMDSCDYILTADKNYIRMINNCGNRELLGRAIRPDCFIDHIVHVPWPKRAPFDSASEFVGLTKDS